jgi:hypothetical protein
MAYCTVELVNTSNDKRIRHSFVCVFFSLLIRICFKLASTSNDKQLKRKLIEQGYEQVKSALDTGNHISSVHKWYGILLNAKSEYGSSDEQIRCAYEVLDHFEETCRLNPKDPTGHHCLGTW